MPKKGNFWHDFRRGWAVGFGAGEEFKAKEEAEKAAAEAAAASEAQHKAEVALHSFIGGAGRLEKSRSWLIAQGIYALVESLDINTTSLTQRQIAQLEEYAEVQYEEQRRTRTRVLDDTTLDRMRRIRWHGQQ